MISPRNQQILLILHLSVFGRPESMAIASELKQGNSESYKVYYETDLKRMFLFFAGPYATETIEVARIYL
ncbi:hypothetical protein DM01DRAFT_1187382 [Hesseltinella vesiculosa]|uniref:Uncharacterized protein n=1 Tax=Hesseltinella vesiculosa TaxID=101127 RepID=A0A1X2GQX2_9FUNG|nr:hypothetical protein DM01DRAFT_1187382 [Hesseltinella vesiculosa]